MSRGIEMVEKPLEMRCSEAKHLTKNIYDCKFGEECDAKILFGGGYLCGAELIPEKYRKINSSAPDQEPD